MGVYHFIKTIWHTESENVKTDRCTTFMEGAHLWKEQHMVDQTFCKKSFLHRLAAWHTISLSSMLDDDIRSSEKSGVSLCK